MDIGRALTYLFRDPAWPRKLLIALALSVLPGLLTGFLPSTAGSTGFDPAQGPGTVDVGEVLGGSLLFLLVSLTTGVFLLGYVLRIVRQVAAGTDLPLPEWVGWGHLAVDGLKAFVVVFVWVVIPFILFALLFTLGGVSVVALGDGGGGGGVAFLVLGCLGLLLALALVVVVPAALSRLATTDAVGEGLNVGAVVATVRSNLGDYVVVALLVFVASIVFGIVAAVVSFALGGGGGGLVVSAVLSGAANFYLYAASVHLYGQAYYRANRGPVLPPGSSFGQLG